MFQFFFIIGKIIIYSANIYFEIVGYHLLLQLISIHR